MTGKMPPGVYQASGSAAAITDGGVSYRVFTSNQLKERGLGYVVRWRVRGFLTLSGGGGWTTPPNNWPAVTSIADGPYFYMLGVYAASCPYQTSLSSHYNSPPTYSGWYGLLNTTILNNYCIVIPYLPEIRVRYVKIQEPTWQSSDSGQDNLFVSIFDQQLVVFEPRPQSVGPKKIIMRQTINNLFYPYTGTCQTPTASEGMVYIGTVYPTDFPNNQWDEAAHKDFTLTFRNCPHTNLKYYVHANGTRWVGGPDQSIVGVNDSIPGDSSPISGNPRGYGIQLQHRTGNHQHTGTIYIHPNEVANPLSLPTTQSYTRNWQGAGASNSSTGVTHAIPMRARLVRTGSSSQQTIQPGSFTTSAIVVIAYP